MLLTTELAPPIIQPFSCFRPPRHIKVGREHVCSTRVQDVKHTETYVDVSTEDYRLLHEPIDVLFEKLDASTIYQHVTKL